MTYEEYLATPVPRLADLPQPDPLQTLEGFCAACGEITYFMDDAYTGDPISRCCAAPPVKLALVK